MDIILNVLQVTIAISVVYVWIFRYFNVVKSMMREVNYSITDHLSKLFMSIENLKDLHRSGHIIGLHSDTHPTQIHNLSYGDQLNEYMKSYEFISSLINEKPTSMSHPCGNYNDDTIKILKKLGINIGFRSSNTLHRVDLKEGTKPLTIFISGPFGLRKGPRSEYGINFKKKI